MHMSQHLRFRINVDLSFVLSPEEEEGDEKGLDFSCLCMLWWNSTSLHTIDMLPYACDA